MSRPDDSLEADVRAAAALPPLEPDSPATVAPAGDVSPVNRLGKYVLHEQIGKGGMALVYWATQGGSGKSVAVKTCQLGERETHHLAARFRREIAIAAALDHANVVRLYDADEDAGRPFLVMELLDGRPVHELLRPGGLRLADACEVARQAARGLAFAHGRGVVHRDVKPGNLILTFDGVVKIIDWGLAKQEGQEDLTDPHQGGGTPGYAPPEQTKHMRSADARADLYSLGMTLWALLIGRTPQEGASLPDGLPPNLDALLRRMLCAEIAGRPASANEVIGVLERFTAGHDLPALLGRPGLLRGELNVEWWDSAAKRARTLHEAGALPMPTGTRLTVDAALNRPAYVYVVWIDTEGKLYPLRGWREGTWEPDAALTPVEGVSVPGEGMKIPLEGAAGTETIVLLAREKPLTAEDGQLFGAEGVERLRRVVSRMPADPRQCYVFPAVGGGLKGPGAAAASSDPVELLHDALRDLCGRFEVVRAVSFANRGS